MFSFALHLKGMVNYFLVFFGTFIKERTTEHFSKKIKLVEVILILVKVQ